MKCWCGIDIGGTSVKLVLLSDAGIVLAESAFSTASFNGLPEFLSCLTDATNRMMVNLSGIQISAIGIGCTGPVNIETGIVNNPFTLPGLNGVCLTESVQKLFSVPVFIENDANAAHLGEVFALGKEDPGNTALITFGTGVGCSVRIGYQLFNVPGGVLPEMGHTSCGIDSDIRCYCGKTNCMENILSGSAVNRDVQRFFKMTPKELFDNPDTEEKQRYIQRITDALFNSVSTLSGIFNSRIVILAGGMGEFFSTYLLDKLQDQLSILEPGISVVPKVMKAQLGKTSGRIGAAILARNQHRK